MTLYTPPTCNVILGWQHVWCQQPQYPGPAAAPAAPATSSPTFVVMLPWVTVSGAGGTKRRLGGARNACGCSLRRRSRSCLCFSPPAARQLEPATAFRFPLSNLEVGTGKLPGLISTLQRPDALVPTGICPGTPILRMQASLLVSGRHPLLRWPPTPKPRFSAPSAARVRLTASVMNTRGSATLCGQFSAWNAEERDTASATTAGGSRASAASSPRN